MIVGFKGDRRGMSYEQIHALKECVTDIMISGVKIVACLHGGEIGSDMKFHEEVNNLLYTEVYPSHYVHDNSIKISSEECTKPNWCHPSLPHFKRNKRIVDRCDILFAAPFEGSKSGETWFTINYANKRGVKVIIL